jgi:hypothetical protein
VSLFQIGTDRTGTSDQLVGNGPPSEVSPQFLAIFPGQVVEKQGLAVSKELPDCFLPDTDVDAGLPFLIGHFCLLQENQKNQKNQENQENQRIRESEESAILLLL